MPEKPENPNEASPPMLLPRLLEKLKTKRSWQIGAVLIVLVLLFVNFLSSLNGRREKRTKNLAKITDEERVIYKESDLRKNTGAGKSGPKGGGPEKAKTAKRNYTTDIAVFIYQEKEKRDSSRPSPLSRSEDEKIQLPAGSKIPGLTSGTIFSFNVRAPATVIVVKDIEKDGRIVIPKDSQFLGEAGVLKTLNRINVNFDLLIFPDGRQFPVKAMALSDDGSSGIKGRVNKHRDTRLLKALGETVLAGAAIFSRGGVSQDPYSLEDRFRENAFDNMTGMAREDLRSVKVDVSITVDSFTPVQVILLESL